MVGTGGTKALFTLSLSSSSSSTFSLLSSPKRFPSPHRVLTGFKLIRPLCSTITISTANDTLEPLKHSILLERLRVRHLKDSSKTTITTTTPQVKRLDPKLLGGRIENRGENEGSKRNKKKVVDLAENFEVLGLTEEVMKALEEMGISEPTEIQCIGIPAVLDGKSVVLGSHTGSGKTLAYMLPLVQLLRQDEALHGMLIKPRRPRAVVLCPTRELCEQVFRVAKAVSHHARFRSTMVSGGGRLRPQEDSLNGPIDMVVGTPGRVLQHIEDGNIVYGDINYVVLDEADTMFDRGFGPDIRKFLAPLKNRASKSGDQGFQTVLVSATMTEAVQKLVDEEFQGIEHLRTSSLHKKISNARHDFIKLSGSENKLEALLQVLEPSLAKGNRVMVFCNTLNSSRAVDHYLSENQISTVNYHGEVPAEQRVENLEKFKSDSGDCPTLVCTDLAARGLDLDVDHVIMFDFPKNSIDYLHRTGRTARMGAKGKVTSLVARKDVPLATRIEEAMMKNESLESLSVDSIKRDTARVRISEQKSRTTKLVRVSNSRNNVKAVAVKSFANRGKTAVARKKPSARTGKAPATFKSKRPPTSPKSPAASSSKTRPATFKSKKTPLSPAPSSSKAATSSGRKISVVGFRGRSSLSNNTNVR